MQNCNERPVTGVSAKIRMPGTGRISLPPELFTDRSMTVVFTDGSMAVETPDPLPLSMPRAGSGPNPVHDMMRLSQAIHKNREERRKEKHGKHHRTA